MAADRERSTELRGVLERSDCIDFVNYGGYINTPLEFV